jgi:ribosomal protein S18 acetylase RimI-like enzyme
MAAAGWDDAQRDAFIDLQFRAHHADYARRFGEAGHRIVEIDGRPVGRLWTGRDDDRLVLVDIALVPEHRGRGIGTALLEGVFAEADREGTPVRLTVARGNVRAAALFERLGCERVGEDAFFMFFERGPVTAESSR